MVEYNKKYYIVLENKLSLASRMNTPGTVGANWKWQVEKDSLTDRLAEKIYHMTKMYGRI